MKIKVLGAGAGGGLPQWNCGCINCNDARAGRIPSMSQSSIAVTQDNERWAVLNASPDIRAQLAQTPVLAPAAVRHTPIESVVVTNGDIDHIAGLVTLREKTPFTLYGTGDILSVLAANSVFNVLDATLVSRARFDVGVPFEPAPGLHVTAFSVPGKVALFLEGDTVDLQEVGDQTVGLLLEADGAKVAYVPGCASIPDWVIERIANVDVLLFDGTVWANDDMQRTSTGEKTGARMGHIPMTGAEGSLARLSDLNARKIFIHINNTNPVLQPASSERKAVIDAGWELAHDGMELVL